MASMMTLHTDPLPSTIPFSSVTPQPTTSTIRIGSQMSNEQITNMLTREKIRSINVFWLVNSCLHGYDRPSPAIDE